MSARHATTLLDAGNSLTDRSRVAPGCSTIFRVQLTDSLLRLKIALVDIASAKRGKLRNTRTIHHIRTSFGIFVSKSFHFLQKVFGRGMEEDIAMLWSDFATRGDI
jgi:hypothetical protein